MPSPPLFSVIIPSFQRPKSLAKAIESVLVQSWSEWELIVVDDGSSPPIDPESLSIYPNQEHNIKWLQQHNQGPAAARKTGAAQATGSYLCFLDDDDYFLPDHLATLADCIADYDYSESVIRTPLIGRYPDDRLIPYPNYNNYEDGLLQYWRSPCGITSLAFPRSVLSKQPIITDCSIIEDFAWISRVLIDYPLLQIPGDATVVYRQHEHNRTLIENDDERLKERINIVEQAYAIEAVRQRIPASVYQQRLAHQWFHTAKQAALNRQFKKGLNLLWKAIKAGGWRRPKAVMATLYHLF